MVGDWRVADDEQVLVVVLIRWPRVVEAPADGHRPVQDEQLVMQLPAVRQRVSVRTPRPGSAPGGARSPFSRRQGIARSAVRPGGSREPSRRWQALGAPVTGLLDAIKRIGRGPRRARRVFWEPVPP